MTSQGGAATLALPVSPRLFLPLAPSESRPGTQPGQVTKSPKTAITSSFKCCHRPRTSVLGKQPALPSCSLPQFFSSESPTRHRQALRLHTSPTQHTKPRGTHSTPAVSALSSQAAGRLGGEGKQGGLCPHHHHFHTYTYIIHKGSG